MTRYRAGAIRTCELMIIILLNLKVSTALTYYVKIKSKFIRVSSSSIYSLKSVGSQSHVPHMMGFKGALLLHNNDMESLQNNKSDHQNYLRTLLYNLIDLSQLNTLDAEKYFNYEKVFATAIHVSFLWRLHKYHFEHRYLSLSRDDIDFSENTNKFNYGRL